MKHLALRTPVRETGDEMHYDLYSVPARGPVSI